MCPWLRANRAWRLSGSSGRRRNLRREVGRRFFDALAEREAREARDLDRPADLAFGFLQRLPDALLVVEDERLLEQRLLLVEGLQPQLGDLFDHRLGLALLAELVGQDVLLALDHRRIDAGGIDRDRIGRGDMHRDLPADSPRVRRPCRTTSARPARRSCRARRNLVVHVARDHALPDRQHGGAAQRHVLADRGDRGRDRVRDRHRAGLRGLDRLDVGAGRERDVGDHLHQSLEMIVARDEVGLGIDLDHRALLRATNTPISPSAATRPAFLAAFDRPFLRSQSTAASMSPLVSPSAALQSIMPAPVFSRRSFTIAAVIFAMFDPSLRHARLAGLTDTNAPCGIHFECKPW